MRAYWCERVPDFAPAPELPLAGEPRTIDTPRFSRVSGPLARSAGAGSRRSRPAAVTPDRAHHRGLQRGDGTWADAAAGSLLNLPMANRLPLHPDVDAVVGDFTSVTLLEVDAADGRLFGDGRGGARSALTDIDHRLFSGVRVMREIKQVRPDAVMPAVFTSLFLDHGRTSAWAVRCSASPRRRRCGSTPRSSSRRAR